HDMGRIVGNRNPPGERGAAEAQVLQSALDKRNHLVASNVGCDKERVRGVMLPQPALERGQSKEIALLRNALDLVPAHRTPPVLELGVGDEDLVDGAIPSFIL